MDIAKLEQETGWRIVHRVSTESTNDDAAALRDRGARSRVAVVADQQVHGRGREGRRFMSPPGGLYVSILMQAEPQHLPCHVVAFASVLVCEAIEEHAPITCGIKWPNDIWVAERKLGGILLEAAGTERPVVIGIGLNVTGRPAALPDDVSAQTTSLADEVQSPPSRAAVLTSLLRKFDAHASRLSDPELASAWQDRLLWRGQTVTLQYAGRPREGVLEAIDLVRGLLVRDALAGPVWLEPAHVQDLRLA